MWSHIFLFGILLRRRPSEFTAILMFEFWRKATAASVPGFLCQSGRHRPEIVSILSSLLRNYNGDGKGNVKKEMGLTSKPATLHVHHALFLSISLPSLHNPVLENGKQSDDKLYHLRLNSGAVPSLKFQKLSSFK